MSPELQKWAEETSLWVAGLWVAGAIAAWFAFRHAWPKIRDFVDTVDLFITLGEKLRAIEENVETVRSQVQNSHGTNLRDDIDRNHAATWEKLAAVEQQVIGVQKQVGRQDQRDIILANELQEVRRDVSSIETSTGAIDTKLTAHLEWSHDWSENQEAADQRLDDRLNGLEDTLEVKRPDPPTD